MGTSFVGRDPKANIHLESRFVSRRHFQFEYQGENRLYLQDLGSQNGTHVNGERVTRCPLSHGDKIKLGDIELLVVHHSYAKPKVIPFPNIKTDPNIDIAEIESRAATHSEIAVTHEPRVKKASLPFASRVVAKTKPPLQRFQSPLLMGGMMTILGGLLAWGAFQWTHRRPLKFSQEVSMGSPGGSPRRSPKEELAIPPEIERPSVPETQVQDQTAALQTAEPSMRQAPLAPQKSSDESTNPPKSKEKDLIAGFDRSLGGVVDGDLKVADRLKTSQEEPNTPGSKASKSVKGESREEMMIEIEMPREAPILQMKPKGERNKDFKQPKYDPQSYQAMLRSKITGVEACYVKHVREIQDASKLSIWFSIAANGKVKKGGVRSSSFKNKSFETCVIEQVFRWNFEKPPWDNFTVNYTFRFGEKTRVKFGELKQQKSDEKS